MLNLNDFKDAVEIYTSKNSRVYRAINKVSNKNVVLKVLTRPSRERIQLVKNEYEILNQLKDNNRFINVRSFFHESGDWIIEVDDNDSVDLTSYENFGELSTEDFLELAIKMVEALDELHSRGITHRDINPSNFIISKDGDIKIIDFGIATKFSKDLVAFGSVESLIGTINYMSPEQSGRINKSVDYRTDLYALGASFFEMLTGQVPFPFDDPLECIYGHLTGKVDFSDLEKKHGHQITIVLNKLLSKKVSDRYQSSYGLLFDLRSCLESLKSNGAIQKFEIAGSDKKTYFNLSEKFYGRERDVEKLVNIYNSLSETNSVFLSGPSGIGKTALAKELYTPITKDKGIFISGKFDQFQGDVLASALLQAVSEFCSLLLSEPTNVLKQWKERFGEALGINAKVLTDEIKELELIMGPQSEPAPLGAMESQTRFQLLFINFFEVICSGDKSIVIFIDDLQWASARSIHLIELLLSNKKNKKLFFIGAFRDNEVSGSHPLRMLLEDTTHKNLEVYELSSLDEVSVDDFLRDTFPSPNSTNKLSHLVYAKTGGNPFSVREFLTHLYTENLCSINVEDKTWSWDINLINKKELSENVVHRLVNKMNLLSKEVQKILHLGSCLGNVFTYSDIKNIAKLSEEEMFKHMYTLIDEGYLLPLKDTRFMFTHDKVQESAYELFSIENSKEIHLKIAESMFEKYENESNVNEIDIVNHLNTAENLILENQDRVRAAKLNFSAALKARASTSFKESVKFITFSKKFISSVDKSSNDILNHEINREYLTSLYLNGDYDECESYSKKYIEDISTEIRKAEVLNVLVILYTAQGRYADAIKYGRKALACLGIDLPSDNVKSLVQENLDLVRSLIPKEGIDSLIEMNEISNDKMRMAIEILINLDSPCYLSDIDLYCIVVSRMVQISFEYGLVPEMSKGYASYGIVLCAYDDFKLGYDFNRVGIQISKKFNHLGQKCRACHTMGNHVQYWSEHIKEGDLYNDEGFKAGYESGEHLWAGFISLFKPYNQFFRGRDLEELGQDINKGLDFCTEHPNQIGIDSLEGLSIALDYLQKGSETIADRERKYIDDCNANSSKMALSMYLSISLQNSFIMKDYDKCLSFAKESEELLPFSFSVVTNVSHYCFQSIAIIINSENLSKDNLEKIEKNQSRMRVYAKSCSDNFEHMYLFVEAEILRHSKEYYKSIEIYNNAISIARRSKFTHIEAMLCERVSEVWDILEVLDCSNLFLEKAISLYRSWGAWSKADSLERSNKLINLNDTSTGSTIHSNINLNMDTVLKAYQILSNKLVKSDLLFSMLKILNVNTGALRGAIFFENKGELILESYLSLEDELKLNQSLNDLNSFPKTIINLVMRSKVTYLNGVSKQDDEHLKSDPFFNQVNNASVLCVPIGSTGVLYLENTVVAQAFTNNHVELLDILLTQLSISLENAELYSRLSNFNEKLENEVTARTLELKNESHKAKEVSEELRATQRELIFSARNAGKADIVTSVLHNIGNSYSSLMTSMYRLEKDFTKNQLSNILTSVLDKVGSYENGLEEFLEKDELGSQFELILKEISRKANRLDQQQETLILELKNKVEEVSLLIKEHQEHGLIGEIAEAVNVEEVINSAISYANISEVIKLIYVNKVDSLVKTDFQNILSIVLNLLTNAATASKGRGDQAQINVNSYLKENKLYIDVIDNGEGIEGEELTRIFQPGISTHKSSNSFGLHNSSNLLNQMGGDLKVSSDGKNLGAKFTIIVPITKM